MKYKFFIIAFIFCNFLASAQTIYDIANGPLLRVTSKGHVTTTDKKPVGFITGNGLSDTNNIPVLELKANGDVFNCKKKAIVGNINSNGTVTDKKGKVLGYISGVTGTISDAAHVRLAYYNAGILNVKDCGILYFFYEAFKL